MSLYKQLWLSIVAMMTLAFVGSFVVSNLSAKAYLEEQLYLKNLDNANSLALSLSSTQPDDPVMLDLFVAAQYDSGHYQFISVQDPQGKVLIERRDDKQIQEAPAWLMAMFPIAAEPGIAQISSGWQQLGTLTLNSHARFAYAELWESTQRLLIYFTVAGLVCGLLGSWLLKLITRPLDRTVDLAEAIGERRFITTPEPRTREFRSVVRAMNRLSERVRGMLEDESAKLERWRQEVQLDSVTGLMNREPFMDQLGAMLQRDDETSTGLLMMVRVGHLQTLNRSQGRQQMDTVLIHLGKVLQDREQAFEGAFSAHLNGSDFALVVPGQDDLEALLSPLYQQLQSVAEQLDLSEPLMLPAAAAVFDGNTQLSELLSLVDTELAQAEQSGQQVVRTVNESTLSQPLSTLSEWQHKLDQALVEKRFELEPYPVMGSNGQLLHMEAPVRLLLDDERLSAGQFMLWLKKLNWCTRLDLIVVEQALLLADNSVSPVCINLSTELLSDRDTMLQIAERLQQAPALAGKLWLELPEAGIYPYLEGFRTLCSLLKPLGCRVGVEHVGPNVSQTGSLHDLGLDYLKIDGAFVQNIDQHSGNQIFLRGLCTIAHSIGLLAIAEQVNTPEQWQTLKELGVDGGTGRYFSQ